MRTKALPIVEWAADELIRKWCMPMYALILYNIYRKLGKSDEWIMKELRKEFRKPEVKKLSVVKNEN